MPGGEGMERGRGWTEEKLIKARNVGWKSCVPLLVHFHEPCVRFLRSGRPSKVSRARGSQGERNGERRRRAELGVSTDLIQVVATSLESLLGDR